MSHANFSYNWPTIYDEDLNIISSIADNYPVPNDVTRSISSDVDDTSAQTAIPSTERVTKAILLSSPRPNQHIIAQGRDFYVTGRFAGVGIIPQDAFFSVEIKNGDGKIVREVSCFHKDDKKNLFLDQSLNTTLEWYMPEIPPTIYDKPKESSITPEKSKELLFAMAEKSCMPDYVCSTDVLPVGVTQQVTPEEAVRFTWNKAYYTDTFFSALIYGGEYGKPGTIYEDELIRTTDREGKEIQPLDEGVYTLLITLRSEKDHGYIISQFTDSITIGNIPNKIMGAFSYPEHRQYLFDKEDKDRQIMFWDPFPGVWTSNLLFGVNSLRMIPVEKETKSGKEIVFEKEKKPLFFFFSNKKRAAFNDSAEYRGGTIHFYDYGMMSTSAALNLEMAEVIRQRALGKSIDVITYHYTNGEYNIAALSEAKHLKSDSRWWGEAMPVVRWDKAFLLSKFPQKLGRSDEYGFSDLSPYISFTRVETDNDTHDTPFNTTENYYDETSRTLSVPNRGEFVEKSIIPSTYQYSRRPPVIVKNSFALYGVSAIPPQSGPLEKIDEYGRAEDVDRVVEVTYCVSCEAWPRGTIKRVTKPLGLIRKVPSVRNPKEAVYKTGLLEFKHVFKISSFVHGWKKLNYADVYIYVEKIKLLRERPDGKHIISINNPEYVLDANDKRILWITHAND